MRSAAVARMQADASVKSYWVVLWWSRLGPVFELVCRWWWWQRWGEGVVSLDFGLWIWIWIWRGEARAGRRQARVLSSGPGRHNGRCRQASQRVLSRAEGESRYHGVVQNVLLASGVGAVCLR